MITATISGNAREVIASIGNNAVDVSAGITAQQQTVDQLLSTENGNYITTEDGDYLLIGQVIRPLLRVNASVS